VSKPRLVLAACCVAALFTTSAQAQKSFAPGVLKVIKPVINGRDAHSLPMALPGISQDYIDQAEKTQWHTVDDTETLRGQTRSIIFHRDIWQHEFSFLPLRQLNVTASNLSGEVRERNIWYLVFRVRNVGANVSHERIEDPKYGTIDYEPQQNVEKLDPITLSDRFFGSFQLSGWVQDAETGEYREITYSDRVSPQINKIVRAEEDPGQPLLDKIQLAQSILERYPESSDEGGTWGVALWYNVNPALDFVSLKISGLTNAYRMEINPDQSITFENKKLQLNFYRPGDGIDQADDKIVYGIPLTDNPREQMEIARRYHLPGPVIMGEILDPESLRSKLIFETDAGLNEDFDSTVAETLDQGQIPDGVTAGFVNAGFNLGGDAQLKTTVPGQQWVINDTVDGKPRTFVIKLQPQFWEKDIDGGIRFIKSLDYLWVYE